MLGTLLKKLKKNEDDDLEFDVKSDQDKGRSNYLRLESPVPNFIPYACHYDRKTILTKNGELLQTIKIVGFTYETLGEDNVSLRDMVREAISKNMNSSNFSLYLHTIRKKKNLAQSSQFNTFFANQLHNKWVHKNHWNDKYINELHITIIHSGLPIEVNFLNSLSFLNNNSLAASQAEAFSQAAEALNHLVESVLDTLSHYGAERLELVFDEGLGYHSELLEFFGNIIHLDETPMALPMADLSKYLARYKIAFGNDALEVRKNESKFFATLLSVKEYHELSAEILDSFLQVDQQFVITQTINFIEPKKAIKHFRYQDYILKLSKDSDMRKILGIDKIMEKSDRNSSTSFCNSQLTIMIVADSLEKLENEVKRSQKELGKIGIAVVREDLNLEHCFWSQLPGNFRYITRQSIMPSTYAGGFASLHNFPAGSLTSKWGNAITLIKTALGTPYFFNFHVGDEGHTIIVGDNQSGKGTMVNFLLSESSKLNPNIFYFDAYHESEIYIRAMGGTYLTFDFEKTDLAARFNPLLLQDNQENREFLRYWFLFLADKYVETSNVKRFIQAIDKAIEKIYSLPKEKRIIRNIAEFFTAEEFSEENQQILDLTSDWYNEGKYAHIFDNEEDELIYNKNIIAIDMTAIYDTETAKNLPVLSYFLHFFKIKFFGKPSIIAVTNANRVFSSIYFEKNLANILDDLTKRNSILLATASFSSQKVYWNEKVAAIFQEKMATKLFLPDYSGYENIKRIFKLSNEEEMYLEALEPSNRQFIIRQADVSIISELNLTGFDPELDILSSSREFAEHCFNIMVELGTNPDVWVPALYKEIDEKIKREQEEQSITVDAH